MSSGRRIFIVAGVVVLVLVIGGIVLFLRSRSTNNPKNPSGNLPPVGDLPPIGTPQPSPSGFPSASSSPHFSQDPADQAAKQGTSIFAPISSKEKQTFTGSVVGGDISSLTAELPSAPTISGELLQGITQETNNLPPELRALYKKPGGPTEKDLLEANQKIQTQFDALTAEINQLQSASDVLSAASTTEQCNKVIADAQGFVSAWGSTSDLSSLLSSLGTNASCNTQLPVGLPSL
jgi:hypothetical protein